MVPLFYLQIGRTEIRSIWILPFALEKVLELASMNALRWFLHGDSHYFGERMMLFSAWMATPQETKAAVEDPKLRTSSASSTGPGMNGTPKNFTKRPSHSSMWMSQVVFTHFKTLRFLGRTKTLHFFGPITCCLTPGFLNGATFPPTK